MDKFGIARAVQVSAHDAVNGDEAGYFTPWLADAIEVLGEAIGLDLLVLEAGETAIIEGKHTEVEVGGFYLDIKARDSLGRIVAIENQYGRADHRHLGQLLTYGAGLGAEFLVWVAENFTDAHVAAIRWLNERTDDQCGVFAVRARFIRIDDSPPAPVFEVVAQPSQWDRQGRRSAATQRDSWTKDRLLKAVVDLDERSRLADLLRRVEATERLGPHDHLWYGAFPNGTVHLHPFGYRYGPLAVWVDSNGRVLVYGMWNNWSVVAGDQGFAYIAEVLEQEHTGAKAPGRFLGELDLDTLWSAMVTTAREINARSALPAEPMENSQAN